MQPTFSKRPSISTIVEEQRKYSAQQLSKIQQSNHKLDKLEERMKSLLERDNNQIKPNQNVPRDFVTFEEPNSDQVNRYFQSSKKYKPNHEDLNDCDNDDFLLDNNTMDHEERGKNYGKRQFEIYEDRNSRGKQSNFEIKGKKQKSTTSLKIFNKKPTKNQISKPFSIGNQTNPNLSKLNSKNSKSISFGNHDSRNLEQNMTKDMSKFSSIDINKPSTKHPIENLISNNIAQMIHPHSDIYEINQLELMMQKSLEIKEKQLLMAKEQLKAIEETKVNEYRKNMELEVHLENIKKFRNEFKIIGKAIYFEKLPINDTKIQVLCEQVTKQREDLENIQQNLLKELKEFEDEQYKLKLQKKRATYEFNSLQREFQKVLKYHVKKMKENIPNNHQNSLVQKDESTQRLVPKRNPSTKSVKTHKKKNSLSNLQPRQSTQYHYQKYLQPQLITHTKRSSIKRFHTGSKQKQPIKLVQKTHENSLKHKISKSISCSGLQNRHTLSSCQAQYRNCTTDKVLIEMVHELDKLKDVVSREIVKTRQAKKGERRVIQLIR